jgi:hypothetical protein
MFLDSNACVIACHSFCGSRDCDCDWNCECDCDWDYDCDCDCDCDCDYDCNCDCDWNCERECDCECGCGRGFESYIQVYTAFEKPTCTQHTHTCGSPTRHTHTCGSPTRHTRESICTTQLYVLILSKSHTENITHTTQNDAVELYAAEECLILRPKANGKWLEIWSRGYTT